MPYLLAAVDGALGGLGVEPEEAGEALAEAFLAVGLCERLGALVGDLAGLADRGDVLGLDLGLCRDGLAERLAVELAVLAHRRVGGELGDDARLGRSRQAHVLQSLAGHARRFEDGEGTFGARGALGGLL